MPRPKTKQELVDASNSSYQKIVALISELPEDARTGSFNFDTSKLKGAHWKRDHNIRDVLIHLYEWQRLLLDWVKNNQAGHEQEFLPEGYNWRNYGEMNQQ
ncbi:ClbS/DfsB family four-helix bundle protein, partial [uncultured Lactobacillus sp.]